MTLGQKLLFVKTNFFIEKSDLSLSIYYKDDLRTVVYINCFCDYIH